MLKEKIDEILRSLPFLILGIFAGIIFIVVAQQGLTHTQLIELLDILIWPAVVLIAVFFFRKVIAYMFFSMEEFNFFGVKGTLKNVKEMIREKATELNENEKRQKEFDDQFRELQDDRNQQADKFTQALNLAKDVMKDNEDLRKQNISLRQQLQQIQTNPANSDVTVAELQDMIADLMAQVAALQNSQDADGK